MFSMVMLYSIPNLISTWSFIAGVLLWQPLVTKINSSTNGKSLKVGYLVGSS